MKWRDGMPYGLGFVAAFVLDMFFELRLWQRLVVYAMVGVVSALLYQLVMWLRKGRDGPEGHVPPWRSGG